LKREGLLVGCIGIFICLLFFLMIYYQEKTSLLDYKLWDVNTVTAADFTTETFFTDEFWQSYLDRDDVKALPKS
jgi:hypothetical protein